ncbi:intercellular adhesion molecule 2 isoform X2 [Microcebus murinus]|uniref:intercellular adhesion molecule 2 isoform X2 n=1 Tax=Microcebus murinus TaxID=30608 RepID=UPI0006437355|nr:intercellular adhesion molecule 2 isoform X1 [Microcebus murinus]
MAPFGCWGLPTALLALLCCPGSGEKAFEVHMWPETLVVEPEESREVNCSTSCDQPDKGGLETSLNKTLLAHGPRWKYYSISNISRDVVLYCYFSCSGKPRHKFLNITVYKPPKQVTLKLQPTWVAVGKSFTMECRVPAVEPLESLTLFLLRGKETLHIQTFGRDNPALQEATAIFDSTAHREDKHYNFSCLAVLDLESRGGSVFRSVSDPQMLEVYEPIRDSQMTVIVAAVSVLLFLFVTSILLCFVFSQRWRQRRTGSYGVHSSWVRLQRAFRAQPA